MWGLEVLHSITGVWWSLCVPQRAREAHVAGSALPCLPYHTPARPPSQGPVWKSPLGAEASSGTKQPLVGKAVTRCNS